MSGAVCPACGVPVTPGYVRCPKCRKPLPKPKVAPIRGGTAIEEEPRRWPLFAVIGAAVVGVIIFVALGRGGGGAAKPAVAPKTDEPTVETPPAQATETAPTFQDDPRPSQAQAPDPSNLARALERDLNRQRLWSQVSVVGARVEVRSSSCGDASLTSTLDAAAAGFKSAGLTKLRCVEQSGRVVSDRDL